MVKGTCWMLVVLAGCGIAQAAPGGKSAGRDRWDAVEALKPGMEIDFLAGNEAGPELCLVSSVNDSTLTCLSESSVRDIRLVFPRAAVQEVRVIELAHERHIGRWIRVGIETAFFIAECIGGGAVGAIVAGLLIVSVEGAISMTPTLPSPPRFHPRLIYRTAGPPSP